MATFRGDALGMELHPVHGITPVLQAHDHAAVGVAGLGRDDQAVGQALTVDTPRPL